MNNLKDHKGNLMNDEHRLTKLGKILRQYSLDELPSIINVLINNMSFVGPRPFIADYKNLYNAYQMRRHDVIPGITGWAQINGRNLINWEEKFDLDIWYVENQSLFLDIKILFLTVWKVLKKEGVNQNVKKTMDRFEGSH
tara:strand:- start:9385 stop:9804 length:420 start_codon:yes stop_codon:yes gene_type:complete